MRDVLLEINSAADREVARDASYHWSNAQRAGRATVVQWTWSGAGVLRRGRSLLECGPGHALLMREGSPTEYFYPPGGTEPWAFSWVNFSGAEEVCEQMVRAHGDVVAFDPEGAVVALIEEIGQRYWMKSFADRYEVSELLGRLVAAMGRELASGGSLRRSAADLAMDYLRDHHRRPINVKEVAVRLSLSREHLTRIFREKSGESPAQFLRGLRLKTACALLRGTALPIGEVANLSGFGSPTHFCRAFRLARGETPLNYRARK